MKKKLAIAAVCAAMILSLTACGAASQSEQPQEPVSETVSSEAVSSKAAEGASSEESQTEHAGSVTAEDAKKLLKDGNQAYLNPDDDAELRQKLTTDGQHPYAVVVTCSDSRVSPEVMFDCGMGDIFVIRTAGNVVDDFEIGSVEYGAEHLGSPLVVVLGHSNCGAVTAACEGGHASGNIADIIEEIAPSAAAANNDLDKAIELNVENSVRKIKESEVMQHMMHESGTQVVGAVYDITTGQVRFLDDTSTEEENHTGENFTADDAKAIALKDAGVTEDQVTNLHTEMDNDDGYPEISVEFIYNNMEYSYEIHGETGAVIEREVEFAD